MFKHLAVAHGTGGSPLVPALFVGAILAATSIGITARVLGDIGKLDTAEGVTILGAAVLDDVLGIIALAIVGGIAVRRARSRPAAVGMVAGKAFGFWIGLTVVVLLLAKPIERFIGHINYGGAMVGLGLALAIVCSGAAESFGLAFIIGAYSVGLGLSRTKLAHKLMEALEPVGDFFVPIFFAALGMLVNVAAMFASWQVVALRPDRHGGGDRRQAGRLRRGGAAGRVQHARGVPHRPGHAAARRGRADRRGHRPVAAGSSGRSCSACRS